MTMSLKITNKLKSLAYDFGYAEGGFCKYDCCESMHAIDAVRDSGDIVLELADIDMTFCEYIQNTDIMLQQYISGYAAMMQTPLDMDEEIDPVSSMSITLTEDQKSSLRKLTLQ